MFTALGGTTQVVPFPYSVVRRLLVTFGMGARQTEDGFHDAKAAVFCISGNLACRPFLISCGRVEFRLRPPVQLRLSCPPRSAGQEGWRGGGSVCGHGERRA